MSSSKPQICLLLALWGKRYIRLFCDVSLRSLLAEGNIPALAKEHSCIFTLLTKPEDIGCFEAQPLFPLLKRYCEVRYVDICDIIFPHNHSATLTVGFERGIRAQSKAALNTYFICLVADYLFGEHSLSGLLPYLRRGVSAITTGNYQVVEEEALGDIRRFIDPSSGTISISNRELVAWSLHHLHPMTVANMIIAGGTRTLHTNRLFWRVDDGTLLGRFYLRHMLCIKPETMDYIIGSSCDYSFIREMCPSGNVVHLADSDEFFLVEVQPLLHEGKYITTGHYDFRSLALNLAAWTTADHRANAYKAIIFHAGEILTSTKAIVEESQRYVSQIEQLIPNPPLPIRGHFYWLSCIQWITAKVAEEPDEYAEKVGGLRENVWESPVFSPPLKAGLTLDRFPPMRDEDVADDWRWVLWWYRFYLALFGQLPEVRIWHPHYLDYRLIRDALEEEPDGPVLLILPPKRRQWIEWSQNSRLILRTPLIAYRDTEELRTELKGISTCVIHLPDEYDSITGLVFDRLLQAMPAGSRIHIFIKSPMFSSRSYSSQQRALRYTHLGQKPRARLAMQRSYLGRTRKYVDKWMNISAAQLTNNQAPPLSRLWSALQVVLLHVYYVVHNATFPMRRLFESSSDKTICSTVFTFEVEGKPLLESGLPPVL